MGGKHYNNLGYADDAALLTGNEKELSLTSKINEVGKQFERKIISRRSSQWLNFLLGLGYTYKIFNSGYNTEMVNKQCNAGDPLS